MERQGEKQNTHCGKSMARLERGHGHSPLPALPAQGSSLPPQLRSPKMESQTFCQQNVSRQIGWMASLSLPHRPTHTNSLSPISAPPSIPAQTMVLVFPLFLPKMPCLLYPFESYPSINTQIQCHFPQEVSSALPSLGELLSSEHQLHLLCVALTQASPCWFSQDWNVAGRNQESLDRPHVVPPAGFEYWLCHLIALHTWATYLTSLCLSFLNCKMLRMIHYYPAAQVATRIQ